MAMFSRGDKYEKRKRRALKCRARIARVRGEGIHRLSVHRSARHIYAQVFTMDGSRSLVSASSLESEIRSGVATGGGREAARLVGELLAQRALKKNIERVAFDRGGFRYHGRVRALAEASRAAGLKF